MTKRERSASKTGTSERISSSSSCRSNRTNIEHSTKESRKGKKEISSHATNDGVNYKGPEARKVAAKKAQGTGIFSRNFNFDH